MCTLFPQASVPGGVSRFATVSVGLSRGGLEAGVAWSVGGGRCSWPVGAVQVVLEVVVDVGAGAEARWACVAAM